MQKSSADFVIFRIFHMQIILVNYSLPTYPLLESIYVQNSISFTIILALMHAKWQECLFWLSTKFQHDATCKALFEVTRGPIKVQIWSLHVHEGADWISVSPSSGGLPPLGGTSTNLLLSESSYRDCTIMEAWVSFDDVQNVYPHNFAIRRGEPERLHWA